MNSLSPLCSADLAAACGVPLFSGLKREQVSELVAHASVRILDRDTLLFSAGDRADRFFIVVEGAVRLIMLNADGDETVIDIVEAVNTFAEAAMFGSGRFPVSGEAMPGTRLIVIEAQRLLRKLRDDPSLGLAMLAALGRWQLRLTAELYRLKWLSPTQRLAWYLLRLAEVSAGPARIRLPYRKAIIAGRIGITPESFSRALARLARHGVESRGNEIVVADVAELVRLCST
jgi:CRP/FNR family transcriptional regulator, dissimilatory nitrate respiration regulator